MKLVSRITMIGIAASALLLLAGCSSNATPNGTSITNSGNISAMTPLKFDWGDINIGGGKKEHTFTFRNDGKESLYLKKAQTSCTCTSARYRLADNSISPKFGMHNNPTSWSREVKPGESFDIEVVFDPMFHGPKATGPIQRSIFMETSAKNEPVKEVRVSGMVLSEKDYKAKYNK